jgi:hypothetical protein
MRPVRRASDPAVVRSEHLTFVIEAMIAGQSPARIWVDDRAVPEPR